MTRHVLAFLRGVLECMLTPTLVLKPIVRIDFVGFRSHFHVFRFQKCARRCSSSNGGNGGHGNGRSSLNNHDQSSHGAPESRSSSFQRETSRERQEREEIQVWS